MGGTLCQTLAKLDAGLSENGPEGDPEEDEVREDEDVVDRVGHGPELLSLLMSKTAAWGGETNPWY